MIDNIQKSIEPISKFFHIVTHPSLIFYWLVDISYWLALIISMISVLFIISTNSKKSKQVLQGTILAYILLKGIASAI